MGSTFPSQIGTRPPFAVLAAVTICAISAYTLLPPALPDITADLGVDASAAGLVIAATTAPGIVLAPLIGVLADRYGHREVLAACLVVFGLAGAAAAFAPSFPALLGLRLAQGVGAAGLIGLVMTIIGDGWAGAERTRMMGRNAAVLTVAIVVAPPLGGGLAALGGWRMALVPYAGGLLAALAVWRLLPSAMAAGGPVAAQVRSKAVAMREPALGGWLARGALGFLLLFGLVLTVLPDHLARLGVGPAWRGVLLAVPALPSAAVALGLGRLTARFGPAVLLRAGFALWALAFALIAAVPTLPGIAAGLLIYGLGDGLALPTLQTAVAGIGPAATRATVIAVFVGATRAGQSAGPLLAAPVLGAPAAAFALGAAIAALLTVTTPRRTS